MAVLALASACRGAESTSPAPDAGLVLRVRADSVLPAGETIRLALVPTDTVAFPTPPEVKVRWTVTSVSGDRPVAVIFTPPCCGALFEGLEAGTVRVVGEYQSHRDSVTIRVTDDRPIIPVALGDSARGSVVNNVSTSRFALSLDAGDVVDLRQLAFGLVPIGEGPRLTPYPAPDQSAAAMGLGLRAPFSGVYMFHVVGNPYQERGGYSAVAGAFTFMARRSRPYFVANPRTSVRNLVKAGTALPWDTVWVQNIGSGHITVSTSASGPVLVGDPTVEITTTSLPRTFEGPVPAGSVPIRFRVDAASVEPGSYTGTLRFALPADVWFPRGSAPGIDWPVVVYDPRITVMSEGTWYGVAAGGGNTYVHGPGLPFGTRNVYRLDPVNGTLALAFSTSATINSSAVGTDGTYYATAGSTLIRFGGSGEPAFSDLGVGTDPAIAAGPQGAMYYSINSLIFRLAPGAGQGVQIGAGRAVDCMRYHPGEDALYYIRADSLYRFDLATKREEIRGILPIVPYLAACVDGVDAQGRLYVLDHLPNRVRVFDTRGILLSSIYTPGEQWDVALLGSELYGVSINNIWKMTLP